VSAPDPVRRPDPPRFFIEIWLGRSMREWGGAGKRLGAGMGPGRVMGRDRGMRRVDEVSSERKMRGVSLFAVAAGVMNKSLLISDGGPMIAFAQRACGGAARWRWRWPRSGGRRGGIIILAGSLVWTQCPFYWWTFNASRSRPISVQRPWVIPLSGRAITEVTT